MDTNLLKKLREKEGFTQEEVAEKLRVTVNTIQNWERTGKPTKESLHELLDIYQVDSSTRNQVVLEIFGDHRSQKPVSRIDNFPEFLFAERQDMISLARNAVLSAEEMELFGYHYYLTTMGKKEMGYTKEYFPMEYSAFQKFGGFFHTMKTLENIKRKIGNYDDSASKDSNLARIVYNHGMMNPGSGFSFCGMAKEAIVYSIKDLPVNRRMKIDIRGLYDRCVAVKNPILIGTKQESYLPEVGLPRSMRELIKSNGNSYSGTLEFFLDTDEIVSQCIEIEKIEKETPDYVERKEQYLSDRREYDKHPDLYDREPSFCYEYEYWLKITDTGRKYLEWVES